MSPLMSIAALALALQAQPAATEKPAATETAQATQAASTTKGTEDQPRIVCKRTAIIGSKFKKRVCGTAKEWERLAQRGNDTASEMRKKGKGGAIGN